MHPGGAKQEKKALLNSVYVAGLNFWYLNKAFKVPDIWSNDACHGEHSLYRMDSSLALQRRSQQVQGELQ